MKMNSPRRIRNNRAKWLLGFFLTVMVILIGRLAYVQIFDHARYVALAKNEVEENEELYNEIYDLVRAEILNKTGNKETSTEDLEADELDLGIENLGEVE